MPNFKTHVIWGMLTFPVMVPIFTLIRNGFQLMDMSDRILILSFICYTLGSDAPDLDHKNAYMHRVAKMIIWMLATIYLFYLLRERMPLWFHEVRFLQNKIVIFYISVITGWLISAFLSAITPPHRGPFHSFLAPVFFGLIVGVLFYLLEIKNKRPPEAISNAIYIGMSSLLGYALHLALDKIQVYRNKK